MNVNVPNLHISELVIPIDREVVGDRRRRRRKSVFQRKRRSSRSHIRRRKSKWRLKCEVLYDAAVLAGVVVDAITGTQNRFFRCLPGDADSRSEIVAIGLDYRNGKSSREGSRCTRENWTHGSDRGINVQVDEPIVSLAKRRDILTPQSKIETQIAGGPPIVLHEQIPGILPEFVCGSPTLDRRELRQAK